MYTLCYEGLVEAGVAIKIEEPIFYDENSVECIEENAFGEPCYH